MPIPLGYRKITNLETPKSLASDEGGIPNGASSVLIQVEGADIRWKDDGNNPTPEDGFLLQNGDAMTYDVSLILFRMVEISPTARVNLQFYK